MSKHTLFEKLMRKWQARTLLKSLVIIGALSGLILGSIGTSVPWLFPKIFSPDPEVIQEVSYLSPSLSNSYESNEC